MENNIPNNIFEDNYKEKIFNGIKENLLLSIISFLWNKSIEMDNLIENEKDEFQKQFLKAWKENIKNITQEQLKEINKILNDNNIDILNLITGKKEIADVEDYQDILNKALIDVENIYWKICGK